MLEIRGIPQMKRTSVREPAGPCEDPAREDHRSVGPFRRLANRRNVEISC